MSFVKNSNEILLFPELSIMDLSLVQGCPGSC